MTNQSHLSAILSKMQESIAAVSNERSVSLYRGESKDYKKVSSALYRKYRDFEPEEFRALQDNMERHLRSKPYVFESASDEELKNVWSQVQHYGGKTNLIDFTTDMNIALFFACHGHLKKDGRVLIAKSHRLCNIDGSGFSPQVPMNRVLAQKSFFSVPYYGYIKEGEYHKVPVAADDKGKILEALERLHDIHVDTIYNDLHGYIRVEEGDVEMFHRGRAAFRRGKYCKAKKIYTKYIMRPLHKNSPPKSHAYYYRGLAWFLSKTDCVMQAKEDLIQAQSLNEDIVALFQQQYVDPDTFQEHHGVELPEALRSLLCP